MKKNEFELVREAHIPEIDSQVALYKHARLGTELLSLSNQDENKVFGITFRTPPKDSTGVAHILEHSVLCGSERFPAKRPFVELLKGSLNTFLNAFTSPDKTSYPVASQNLQDFYNLIDVYIDAVLHPLIPRHILDQEGWRYEYDTENGRLFFKGVVFNEMKGVHSDPDHLLGLWSRRSLFRDNTYQFDSGGDPHEIPNLTYEQFQDFHDKYYHPSNARIYFYGDDPPQQRLVLLTEYLLEFEEAAPDSEIPLQTPATEPVTLHKKFASGEIKPGKGIERLAVNWLLPFEREANLVLAFQILDHILMGTPGSPLRKRLMDSGLGEDLTGYGSAAYLRQLFFSVGMKGIREGKADEVRDLILLTLEQLGQSGFDQETIEASINTIEFRLREQNTGSYPRGLLLMMWSLNFWLHDGDPIVPLAFEKPLAEVKTEVANGGNYFGGLIDEYLIRNPHRTVVVLSPDPQMGAKMEAAETDRLRRAQEAMTDAEIQELVAYNHWLKTEQEKPDTPEVLSKIPSLEKKDLDPLNKAIPSELRQTRRVPTLVHDLPTNGIVYLDLAFNLRSLRQADLPLIRLFGRGLYELGTKSEDYVQLSRRISRLTGGIRSTTMISPAASENGAAAWWLLRGKATENRIGALLDILRELLMEPDFSQRTRFRQMIDEEISGQESSLLRGGHVVVGRRLRARLNEAAWISEQTAGVEYLLFLRELRDEMERDWPSVERRLTDLRQRLVSTPGLVCNVTAGGDALAAVERHLASFVDALPDTPIADNVWLPDMPSENEALVAPTQVNYVGKGARTYDMGYQLDGSVEVILKHLRSAWLWEKIRVQGGAYGAGVSFNRHSGLLGFYSYRDPNIGQTIQTFDGAADYLRTLDLSDRELTKTIIGTIGDLDAYRLPDARGFRALSWYLIGDTAEARQIIRDQILSTTLDDFRDFADVLAGVGRHGLFAVLGSREKILAEDPGLYRFNRLLEVL